MATGNFNPGCFAYVTVGDLRRHIMGNDFEDRHRGRLALDRVLAKIIWSREAYDFLHSFTPNEENDIVLINLGNNEFVDLSEYLSGVDYTSDEVFETSNTGASNTSTGNGTENISEPENNDTGDGEPTIGAPKTSRWPRVNQPPNTGLKENEIMIPAGSEQLSSEDSGDETEEYSWGSL